MFFISLRSDGPSTSDTFVAEVSQMWVQRVEDDTGGIEVYRVALKQGEKEFTCRVSPIRMYVWSQLKTSKRYQFTVTRTDRRCFIKEINEVDETNPSGME